MSRPTYSWGNWIFDTAAWRLIHATTGPAALQNRTLDLLALLLERAPGLVTKADILEVVWGDSVVEEGNVAFHIAALRRTLDTSGESCIQTVRGRGYRFAEPVTRLGVEGEGVARVPDVASGAPPRRVRFLWIAALLVGVMGSLSWFTLRPAPPAFPTITVRSTEDGLAEVVAARLSVDTTLKAAAGPMLVDGEDAAQTSRRLGAEVVLQVRLDRGRDPWRAVAELIRADDHRVLWGWQFLVPVQAPPVAEAQIATRISSGLGQHLNAARTGGASRSPAVAHDMPPQPRKP